MFVISSPFTDAETNESDELTKSVELQTDSQNGGNSLLSSITLRERRIDMLCSHSLWVGHGEQPRSDCFHTFIQRINSSSFKLQAFPL